MTMEDSIVQTMPHSNSIIVSLGKKQCFGFWEKLSRKDSSWLTTMKGGKFLEVFRKTNREREFSLACIKLIRDREGRVPYADRKSVV